MLIQWSWLPISHTFTHSNTHKLLFTVYLLFNSPLSLWPLAFITPHPSSFTHSLPAVSLETIPLISLTTTTMSTWPELAPTTAASAPAETPTTATTHITTDAIHGKLSTQLTLFGIYRAFTKKSKWLKSDSRGDEKGVCPWTKSRGEHLRLHKTRAAWKEEGTGVADFTLLCNAGCITIAFKSGHTTV